MSRGSKCTITATTAAMYAQQLAGAAAAHSARAAVQVVGSRWLTSWAALGPALGATLSSSTSTHPSGPGSEASSRNDAAASATTIYATCVLERLPVVMPAAPQWEEEHSLWLRSENLRDGFVKVYPDQPGKKGGEQSPNIQRDLREFKPVPVTTPADAANDWRSMKRRLDQRLYLLVRRQALPGEPGTPGGLGLGPGAAAAAASTSQPLWQFPAVQVQQQAGESMRQASERALSSAVGRAHPVYFIGNAPMAHLTSIPPGRSSFFMLAQVVGDPWQAQLKQESGCEDVAWVTKDELPQFIQDPRLRDLAKRML